MYWLWFLLLRGKSYTRGVYKTGKNPKYLIGDNSERNAMDDGWITEGYWDYRLKKTIYEQLSTVLNDIPVENTVVEKERLSISWTYKDILCKPYKINKKSCWNSLM